MNAVERASHVLWVSGCTASAHWAKILDEAHLLRDDDEISERAFDLLYEAWGMLLNGASRPYIDDWQSRWNGDGLAILERRSAKEAE